MQLQGLVDRPATDPVCGEASGRRVGDVERADAARVHAAIDEYSHAGQLSPEFGQAEPGVFELRQRAAEDLSGVHVVHRQRRRSARARQRQYGKPQVEVAMQRGRGGKAGIRVDVTKCHIGQSSVASGQVVIDGRDSDARLAERDQGYELAVVLHQQRVGDARAGDA
jgi:hypothetical protein